MPSIADYIEQYKKKNGITNRSALARSLGKSRQYFLQVEKSPGSLSEELAIVIAKDIGANPGIILAQLHAERSKNPDVKSAWSKLAKQLGTAASVLFLSSLTTLPSPADASANGITQQNSQKNPIYYVK